MARVAERSSGYECRPWLQIQDVQVSDDSLKPVEIGFRRGRPLVFHRELTSLLLLWEAPTTVDIREQFPMRSAGTQPPSKKSGGNP